MTNDRSPPSLCQTIGRADGAARIACRRLHIDAPERRHAPDLAVGDGIHGAAAREREIGRAEALLHVFDQMKERLLVHRLNRAGDVAVTILERIVGLAARAQQFLERWRKQIAELRRAVGPLIGDTLAMMPEIGEIERIAAIGLSDDLAHGVHEGGLAVRRKPHDLVLVAVMRKAEILGERLIEDAERMRENRPDLRSRCRAPPAPQAALAKSPKPSTETTTASSNGET